MPQIKILAYGSLDKAVQEAAHRLQDLPDDFATSVADILNSLGISSEAVQLVMLNHCSVSLDALVRSGDRIAFFPQEYPVFPDWKDYRSN